jgi:hypothetical protein
VSLTEPNRMRLVAYLRKAAPFHAADPDAWRWRQMAGDAVKRRVRLGPQKARVLQFSKTRNAR